MGTFAQQSLNRFSAQAFHRVERQQKLGGPMGELIDLKPQLEWVRVGDLNIDHNYQRDFVQQNWVAEIATNFDVDLFYCLAVNMRDDGTLWCYDGQHRMLAVIERFGPDMLVPAFVTFGKTAEEESRLFRKMQTHRRPVTPLESFKAQLFEGKLAAIDINEIVEQAGFAIAMPGRSGKLLACVGTIESLYYPQSSTGGERKFKHYYVEMDPAQFGPDWAGRKKLVWALQTLALAWNYKEQFSGKMLREVGFLWSAQRHMTRPIDQERMAKVLSERSPNGWDFRRQEKMRPLWAVIADDYNKGLRGGGRIPTAIVRAEREQGIEFDDLDQGDMTSEEPTEDE
jgi:hypothetical protein